VDASFARGPWRDLLYDVGDQMNDNYERWMFIMVFAMFMRQMFDSLLFVLKWLLQ